MPTPIRQLPDQLVNQIAAGEVIERPASALKELVENAIDAGATRIEIDLQSGGLAGLIVRDNGHGMGEDDLVLSVQRHATSKLTDDNLFAISHFGFRGEALPSIASVAKLTIASRTSSASHGWELSVAHGKSSQLKPAAIEPGTHVSITDLFSSVPARLKFLKTQKTEAGQCYDVIKRLAMSRGDIAFVLKDSGKTVMNVPAQLPGQTDRIARLSTLIGQAFAKEAVNIDAVRDGLRLTGLAGLPTMNRPTTANIFLFVNDRPVRDKQLLGAIRAGYQDMLPRGRHPIMALFLDIPLEQVDVNVHPAKAEVRFRDAGAVRSLFVGALTTNLRQAGMQATAEGGTDALRQFSAPPTTPMPSHGAGGKGKGGNWRDFYRTAPAGMAAFQSPLTPPSSPQNEVSKSLLTDAMPMARYETPADEEGTESHSFPLGAARAQLHLTYILAETKEGICLVDQHAAHERLVMEEMKIQRAAGEVESQALLIPEIVELPADHMAGILEIQEDLKTFGLHIEGFGEGAVLVRNIPAALGKTDIIALVKDVAEEIIHLGGSTAIEERLGHIIATISCHGSVRAGRKLNADEMNALLRQMEATPAAGQCNHGRPTYVKLLLTDIEKLFKRR